MTFFWPTDPIASKMECIARASCKRRGVGWEKNKIPGTQQHKIEQLLTKCFNQTLIAFASFIWLTDPIASIMECIATISCKRRWVGWERTKYPELNSIKLNNFFQNGSIKLLLHLWPSLDPQTPLQAKWSALLELLVNAGGGVRKGKISRT